MDEDGEIKNCEIEGFTTFCPLAVKQDNGIPSQNDQAFCTAANKDILTKKYWDFNRSPGSCGMLNHVDISIKYVPEVKN